MMNGMKRFSLAVAVLGLAVGAASPARAGVLVTFEGFSNTIYNAPITRSGFVFGNPTGQEQHFHEIDSTNFGLTSNGTGVLLNDRATQNFVVAADASVFTLGSVDVATAANNRPAVGLTIAGFLNKKLGKNNLMKYVRAGLLE